MTRIRAAALVLGSSCGAMSAAVVSPAACVPNRAGLFLAADAVIEAAVKGQKSMLVRTSYDVPGNATACIPPSVEPNNVSKSTSLCDAMRHYLVRGGFKMA